MNSYKIIGISLIGLIGSALPVFAGGERTQHLQRLPVYLTNEYPYRSGGMLYGTVGVGKRLPEVKAVQEAYESAIKGKKISGCEQLNAAIEKVKKAGTAYKDYARDQPTDLTVFNNEALSVPSCAVFASNLEILNNKLTHLVLLEQSLRDLSTENAQCLGDEQLGFSALVREQLATLSTEMERVGEYIDFETEDLKTRNHLCEISKSLSSTTFVTDVEMLKKIEAVHSRLPLAVTEFVMAAPIGKEKEALKSLINACRAPLRGDQCLFPISDPDLDKYNPLKTGSLSYGERCSLVLTKRDEILYGENINWVLDAEKKNEYTKELDIIRAQIKYWEGELKIYAGMLQKFGLESKALEEIQIQIANERKNIAREVDEVLLSPIAVAARRERDTGLGQIRLILDSHATNPATLRGLKDNAAQMKGIREMGPFRFEHDPEQESIVKTLEKRVAILQYLIKESTSAKENENPQLQNELETVSGFLANEKTLTELIALQRERSKRLKAMDLEVRLALLDHAILIRPFEREINLAMYQLMRFSMQAFNLRTTFLENQKNKLVDDGNRRQFDDQITDIESSYNAVLVRLQEFDNEQRDKFKSDPYPSGEERWTLYSLWAFFAKSYELLPTRHWRPNLTELVLERQLALNGIRTYRAAIYDEIIVVCGESLKKWFTGDVSKESISELLKKEFQSVKELMDRSPLQAQLLSSNLIRTYQILSNKSDGFADQLLASANNVLTTSMVQNILKEVVADRMISNVHKLNPRMVALIRLTNYLPYASGSIKGAVGTNLGGQVTRLVTGPIGMALGAVAGWQQVKLESHFASKIPVDYEIALNAILRGVKTASGTNDVMAGLKDAGTYVVMRKALEKGSRIYNYLRSDKTSEQVAEETKVLLTEGSQFQVCCLQAHSYILENPWLTTGASACGLLSAVIQDPGSCLYLIPAAVAGGVLVRGLPAIAASGTPTDKGRVELRKIETKYAMQRALAGFKIGMKKALDGEDQGLVDYVKTNADVLASNLGVSPDEVKNKVRSDLVDLVDNLNEEELMKLEHGAAMKDVFSRVINERVTNKKTALKDVLVVEEEKASKAEVIKVIDADIVNETLFATDQNGKLLPWVHPDMTRAELQKRSNT